VFNKPHYKIKIGEISLYADNREFLNALTYLHAVNQQKLAFNVMLDTHDLRVYYCDPSSGHKKLCWRNNKPENFEIDNKETIILSKSEEIVLDLLADGKDRKEISLAINKSIGTINFHLNKVKEKFGLRKANAVVAEYMKLKNDKMRKIHE
jgi:DNA-binding CsgD family transcriptional regulator